MGTPVYACEFSSVPFSLCGSTSQDIIAFEQLGQTLLDIEK